jgi:hypothetical protein
MFPNATLPFSAIVFQPLSKCTLGTGASKAILDAVVPLLVIVTSPEESVCAAIHKKFYLQTLTDHAVEYHTGVHLPLPSQSDASYQTCAEVHHPLSIRGM